MPMWFLAAHDFQLNIVNHKIKNQLRENSPGYDMCENNKHEFQIA